MGERRVVMRTSPWVPSFLIIWIHVQTLPHAIHKLLAIIIFQRKTLLEFDEAMLKKVLLLLFRQAVVGHSGDHTGECFYFCSSSKWDDDNSIEQ
jgi:hypothetical protein